MWKQSHQRGALAVVLILAAFAFLTSTCGPRSELARAGEKLKNGAVDERKTAAAALGEMKSDAATRLLLDALSDPDLSVRDSVTEGLRKAAEGSIEVMIAELQNSGSKAREVVIRVIAPKKDARTLAPLIAILKSGSAGERTAAVDALGLIGAAAYDSVAALQHGADTETLVYSTRALGRIGDSRAIPSILTNLQNPNLEVRRSSIEALGGFRDQKVVEALIPMLEIAELRETAVLSLGHAASANVPVLAAGFKDKSLDGKLGLIRALGLTRSAEAVSALAKIILQATAGDYPFSDENTKIQEQAEKSMAEVGPKAVIPLLEILRKDSDTWLSSAASSALDKAIDGSTIQLVIDEMLSGRSETSVHRSALALASTANQAKGASTPNPLSATALNAILTAFDSEKPMVRQNVASAVRYQLNDKIEKKLGEALQRKDSAVLAGAYEYFIEKGIPGSEDTMVEALNKFGHWFMGEAYLNCGNKQLQEAARAWAGRNGFTVKPSDSPTSSTSWGSKR